MPNLVEIGPAVLVKPTWIFITQRGIVPRLKLAQWFWRRFLNFFNVFSLVRNYLHLEKGGTLHLNKFEFPSPENAMCQVWLKLAQWILKRFFKISSTYVRYFEIISPLERVGSFIWITLNPLYPRMLCTEFGWNWPRVSGKEDFLNFVNVFSLIFNYLPLEKDRALHLNKFESHIPKNAMCQV